MNTEKQSRWIELVTNADGRLSTTATVQMVGFIVLAAVLLVSVLYNRESASELYMWFAAYCGGLTVSKGIVTTRQTTRRHYREGGDE